jgi:Putative transposase/Transposase zinc-binding domain
VAAHPATAGRPRFDIGEIVRRHRAALESVHRLNRAQRRVLTDVAQCRTAALGGHLDACLSCGYEHPAYNSCRNRHCPKCQALSQEEWIAKRSEQLLDVGHFHVVFTLPAQLRSLAKFASELLYDAIFAAAAGTLRRLGEEQLGITLGVTMVLHTWTRDLRFHPHVHAIVTAGGLTHDGRWVACNGRFLFPVHAMGKIFRGKMMDRLRRDYASGRFARFDAFQDPQGFDVLMAKIAKLDWNVYAKAPFAKSQHVLSYLGRYTHRVGIANSRLLAVSPEAVTFRTKGDGVASVTPVEFLRRFVQHVLPDGFHKIRHYGLYASGAHANREVARALLGQATQVRRKRRTSAELLLDVTGRDVSGCPRCGAKLVRRPLPPTHARAPPTEVAA